MPNECANPLLLQWVGEWVDAARDRNSKGFTTYKKAYNSIKACPLTFQHPSEAQQLNGLGPKLCERLTERMREYCEENGLPMPKRRRRNKIPSVSDDGDNDVEDDEEEVIAPKPKRAKKLYVPTLRSGAYGLILGLASISEEANVGLTKAELIEVAQPYSGSSFSAPSDPTKFYTAWSSMKTLVDKDLVQERGRPLRRYLLTDEGWEVAKRIRSTIQPNQTISSSFAGNSKGSGSTKDQAMARGLQERGNTEEFIELNSSPVQRSPSLGPSVEPIETMEVKPVLLPTLATDDSSTPNFSPIILPPSCFTVQLVLDIREIRATKDRDYMEEQLTQRGMKPIMRSLDIGDVLWVAKVKDNARHRTGGHDIDEIMLDWVVERKRLDDLVGSIKDGRFHEQKFRLRKSGVENVVYLVEEISMVQDTYTRVQEMVESAIASTQVVNGYFVKKTQKMDDTIRYLARMTKLLQETYAKKPLHIIPTAVLSPQNYLPLLASLKEKQPSTSYYIDYRAFASLSSKSDSLTLRDVYLKMLMCTRGVTGEKALEIQKRWKTPAEFVEAFGACGDGEQRMKRKRELVKNEMSGLIGRKKIASALSTKIAEVWGDAK